MEFNIGDIVQLNSGGPEMTIQDILGKTTSKAIAIGYATSGHLDGELICKWFAGDELKTGVFKPEMLDKYDFVSSDILTHF